MQALRPRSPFTSLRGENPNIQEARHSVFPTLKRCFILFIFKHKTMPSPVVPPVRFPQRHFVGRGEKCTSERREDTSERMEEVYQSVGIMPVFRFIVVRRFQDRPISKVLGSCFLSEGSYRITVIRPGVMQLQRTEGPRDLVKCENSAAQH